MDKSELSEVLGYVSSSVGHQVINSLSTIVSQVEILRSLVPPTNDEDAAEVQERIETMIRVSLDASTVARRLLELSHDLTAIDNEDSTASAQEIDLGELASQFVHRDSPIIGPGVQWELEIIAAPRIKGNVQACLKMLRLLTTNAVESLPEGGRGKVIIASRPGPRDWATLEVRDTGCGMSAETLEHAAEPFFTTKPGRRGLGLTIARGIWRRHRGSLVIESQPGLGTSVRLSAPSIQPE